MPRRKKTEKAEKPVYERVECRWRRGENTDVPYEKGKLIVGLFNKDGSCNVVCGKTGGIRAIMPEFIQVTTKGPRGGKKWVQYIPG